MPTDNSSNISIQELDSNFQTDTSLSGRNGLCWVDCRTLTLEGLGWPETSAPFTRLPNCSEGEVRDPIWQLSRYSAGVCVRFLSNTKTLAVRWSLRNERLAMPHMPATGVSGLDLYVRDTNTQRVRWAAVARPEATVDNEEILLQEQPEQTREYFLYLPLYNGVCKLKIGIDSGAEIRPADPRGSKPICFYGASLVQGACASRPGLALPAQLGRRFEREVWNFGFSGNSWAEPEIATLLAELDPALYVVGPAPSLKIKFITENLEGFLRTLRLARAKTPIVLVENALYQDAWTRPMRYAETKAANRALRKAFENSKKHMDGLYFVENENVLGEDGEATVDGTHPTDVGFLRLAGALAPKLKVILSEERKSEVALRDAI